MSEQEVNLVVKALFTRRLELIEAACRQIRDDRVRKFRLAPKAMELWLGDKFVVLKRSEFRVVEVLACDHFGQSVRVADIAREAQIAPSSVSVVVNKIRDQLERLGFQRSEVIQNEPGSYRWSAFFGVVLDPDDTDYIA